MGIWNVRSINQGKLDVVMQEYSWLNLDILGISKLKWAGMGKFNSDDHYIYYSRQESLRRNGVDLRVNRRVWNAVLRCSLKNDRMISFHFQGKSFSIWQSKSISHPLRRSWSWMSLWRPTRLPKTKTKKRCLFYHGDWNANLGSQEIPAIIGKFGFGVQNEAGKD